MKAVRIAMALAVVVAIAAYVVAQEKPWFDMKNCAMCSTLASKPGLLEAMTWDHYPIANGLMTVSSCPEQFKATMNQAMTEMGKVQEKIKAGEKVYLDGYCTTYGELMAAGAKVENVHTSMGDVTLMTSNDPKVVAKIHEFGQRTIDELAKMAAAAKAPAEGQK